MEEDLKELQLLPTAHPTASSSRPWPAEPLPKFRSAAGEPSLDLQLSISVRPISRPAALEGVLMNPLCEYTAEVETVKWQAAEQIRLAAVEKAYAERVRELTRREMEMAQSEFARARQMWERAREEVEKAERLKEKATRRLDSTGMEITCQACRQKFLP
ncbi:protein indeterminate-domain 16 [Diospyros lotus]|uniref:protein indeterminate-domain 16 n=1 Tax=Diospyros lotus TaxID=55363 RepID=UPI002257F672|nr:protein indeterminate-domain 16 [Diospyros lotus]